MVVADAPDGARGAWTSDGGGEGTIIFARSATGEGLFRRSGCRRNTHTA